MQNYTSWPIVCTTGFVLLLMTSLSAQAQKPILVHNQDSTYLLTEPTLEMITITGNRFPSHLSLEKLALANQLNTNISGVTKDLQRDLPSILRLYTQQGIPLLTKYASNNSLNTTIPDSAIGFELRDLGALYPNPDAPVVVQTNYRRHGSLSLSPLVQTFFLGAGTQKPITGNVALSHSGAPKMLENVVPSLHAYNTTLGGYSGLRANYGGHETEVIFHHSQSSNEYSQQLAVNKFKETDYNTNIVINYKIPLDNKILQANITHQKGRSQRNVEETFIDYEVLNQIEATSYTIGINNDHAEFRAYYHELERIYPYSNYRTVDHRHFETSLSYRNTLFRNANYSLQTRFDHHDNEPSISGIFRLPILKNLFASINGGRLYDAVGSEGLNNLMESVQMKPHPWTTMYGKIDTDLYLGPTTINASVAHKKLNRGWYAESANIRGWIARLGASGRILIDSPHYIQWSFGGTIRELSLDRDQKKSQIMPEAATRQGHAGIEATIGNMIYSVQADAFAGREIRITNEISSNLGPQYFLSLRSSRKMGSVKLGVSFDNALALLGKENYILAHYNRIEGINFVKAPPIVNVSLGINFY